MSRKSFVEFMNILRKRYDIDLYFNEIKCNMPKTFLEHALEESEYNYNSKSMIFNSSLDQTNFYFYFELKGSEQQVYAMTIPTEYLLNPQKVEQFSQDLPERVLSVVVLKNGIEKRLEITKGTKVEANETGKTKAYMIKARIYVKNLKSNKVRELDLQPKTVICY